MRRAVIAVAAAAPGAGARRSPAARPPTPARADPSARRRRPDRQPSTGAPCTGEALQGRPASCAADVCRSTAATVDGAAGLGTQRRHDGKTFDIALIRVRPAQPARPDRLAAGQPGRPGRLRHRPAPSTSPPQLPDAITDRFDLVGFDPRGVGQSDPVKCISDADQDAQLRRRARPGQPRPTSTARSRSPSRSADALRRQVRRRRCRYFSTEQAARDMDAIRAARRRRRSSTYLGYSYGTLLGAVYAQLFPTNIRAMVLDGAVDPTQDPVAALRGPGGGLRARVQRLHHLVQGERGPVPDRRRTRAAAVADALDAGPDRRRCTAPTAATATAGWVFTARRSRRCTPQRHWPPLAQAHRQPEDGRRRG